MTKAETRKYLESIKGRYVSFVYKEKYRTGSIVRVVQGPAYAPAGTKKFRFVNMPDGEVYFDLKGQNGPPRTFAWDRVIGFDCSDYNAPAPMEEQSYTTIRVRRMRPTLGEAANE